MAKHTQALTHAAEAKRAWNSYNTQIVTCEFCPRLREYCTRVADQKRRAYANWNYWGRPVPNFGDPAARLLIVGLAPGAHGANRTGRMFTGDRSGDWLYRALNRVGYANQAESSRAEDGLSLTDCAITAVCHCAPPDNKPNTQEILNCRTWLQQTFAILPARVYLALGQVAWQAVVRHALTVGWYSGRHPKFGHAAQVALARDRWLIGSYHPSQQNTFTGRLTEKMLDDVCAMARRLATGRN